jgi:putative hydrolase of the HAD superfamily
MGRVKAVLFDLGGTLIKASETAETFKKILQAHGVERSLEEIARAHREAGKYLSRDTVDYAQLAEEYWERWNRRVLEFLNVKENLGTLVRALTIEWFHYADVRLYPDADEALRRLKDSGVKLALVTNALQSDVDAILPKIGLTNFFDITVASDTLGKTKPDSAVFLFALEGLGVEADEAMCVGDDVEKDCEAAERIGIRSLLIDRRRELSGRVEAIRDLRELLTFIVPSSGRLEFNPENRGF